MGCRSSAGEGRLGDASRVIAAWQSSMLGVPGSPRQSRTAGDEQRPPIPRTVALGYPQRRGGADMDTVLRGRRIPIVVVALALVALGLMAVPGLGAVANSPRILPPQVFEFQQNTTA